MQSIPGNNHTINDAPQGAAPQCGGSKKGIEFGMIPLQDLEWAADQKPAIMQLFLECWRSDPYGNRWMPLTTNLKDKTLKQAKSALRKAELFDFKTEMRILEDRRYYETLVINLRGSRRSHPSGVVENPTKEQEGYSATPGGANNDPTQGSLKPQVGYSTTPGGVKNYPTYPPQTLSQSGSQEAPRAFHDLFNKFQESLSISEREIFLTFGRKKANELPKPPSLPDKWVEANWQELYRQFQVSEEGRRAKQEAIVTRYDWENDPRLMSWLQQSYEAGFLWTQEVEAEREERTAFYSWAQQTNAYEGRVE